MLNWSYLSINIIIENKKKHYTPSLSSLQDIWKREIRLLGYPVDPWEIFMKQNTIHMQDIRDNIG